MVAGSSDGLVAGVSLRRLLGCCDGSGWLSCGYPRVRLLGITLAGGCEVTEIPHGIFSAPVLRPLVHPYLLLGVAILDPRHSDKLHSCRIH